MASFIPGKRLLRKTLSGFGLELRRIRPLIKSGAGSFSFADEDAITRDLLTKMPVRYKFVVDIGAGDGEYMSNSYALFQAGWEGLGVEWNGNQFAALAARYAAFSGARLLRARVTPDNVLNLLAACETPKEFGFLSLDIDSYDHFVLEKLLTEYRPALICAEVNEKIPPPLRFTAKWEPEGAWGKDHFYGQSLSMLDDLGKSRGYDLVRLEYNNAFLVRRDLNPVTATTPAEAYRTGYVERQDRHQRFPWNSDMESVIALPTDQAREFIRKRFERYEGHFILE